MSDRRRRLRRVVVAALAVFTIAAAAEFAARRSLPKSGLTPFRGSAHPRLPAELRPGYEGIYTGVGVRVNSLGMRGREPEPRDADVARVLLVGDSFVFGSGVEEEDTLAVLVEAALRARGVAAEVWNLGVPGYNCEDAADVVEARAPAAEADAIVYVFFGNDIDPRQPRADPPASRRIDARHGFPLRSAALQWSYLRAKTTALRLGIDVDARARAGKAAQAAAEGGERVDRSIERMERDARAAGSPLAVAVYPFLTFPATNPFTPADELAIRVARERGLRTVDLRPLLVADGDPHRFWANPFDSHPNGAANRIAADALAESLAELLASARPAAGPP